MAGIKVGDRVLQVGCRNPRMFATFGLQVGFSGHSCALVETKETADRAQKRRYQNRCADRGRRGII